MRHIKSKAHSSLKRTPFTWIRGKLPLSQHGWKTIDLLYSTQMMGPVSLDIKNVHLGKELRNFLCDATRPYVSKHLYVVGYASSNCHANTIHVKKQLFGRDYQNGQDLWHFRPPNFSFCKPLRQCCMYMYCSAQYRLQSFLPKQTNCFLILFVCMTILELHTLCCGGSLGGTWTIMVTYEWCLFERHPPFTCQIFVQIHRTNEPIPANQVTMDQFCGKTSLKNCALFKKSEFPIVCAPCAVLWNWVISHENWVWDFTISFNLPFSSTL